MEKFNLEQARNGRPVVTRSGKPARIINFEKNDNYPDFPIVALVTVKDNEVEYRYNNEGKLYNDKEDSYDLMMADYTDKTITDLLESNKKVEVNLQKAGEHIKEMQDTVSRQHNEIIRLKIFELVNQKHRLNKNLFDICENIYNWVKKTN